MTDKEKNNRLFNFIPLFFNYKSSIKQYKKEHFLKNAIIISVLGLVYLLGIFLLRNKILLVLLCLLFLFHLVLAIINLVSYYRVKNTF